MLSDLNGWTRNRALTGDIVRKIKFNFHLNTFHISKNFEERNECILSITADIGLFLCPSQFIFVFVNTWHRSMGTTRPIPRNWRSCRGCIRWKDMSNPIRLRWHIVLTETYEIRSAITIDRKQCATGTTRLISPNQAIVPSSILYIDVDVTMC